MERQGNSKVGKRERGEAGKQGRHVHPFLMRCLGVSKDDGCLKEILLLRYGRLPEQMTYHLEMCRGESNKWTSEVQLGIKESIE